MHLDGTKLFREMLPKTAQVTTDWHFQLVLTLARRCRATVVLKITEHVSSFLWQQRLWQQLHPHIHRHPTEDGVLLHIKATEARVSSDAAKAHPAAEQWSERVRLGLQKQNRSTFSGRRGKGWLTTSLAQYE
jgi:hypothetical protein